LFLDINPLNNIMKFSNLHSFVKAIPELIVADVGNSETWWRRRRWWRWWWCNAIL